MCGRVRSRSRGSNGGCSADRTGSFIAGLIGLGIYIGVTKADWLVLILAIICLDFLGLFFLSNEGKYRSEP